MINLGQFVKYQANAFIYPANALMNYFFDRHPVDYKLVKYLAKYLAKYRAKYDEQVISHTHINFCRYFNNRSIFYCRHAGENKARGRNE